MPEQKKEDDLIKSADIDNDIKTGSILNDKYVVDECVSHSSKAGVYHCYSDGRQYAAKVYNIPYVLNKFKATLLRGVDSPYLTTVTDVFEYNGLLVVVTPYYDKGNLKHKIFTDKEIKGFVLPQIIEALNTLHSVNLFHGNLKPANILLNDDGKSIALTDYAHYVFSNDNLKSLNVENCFLCNKEYAAPEVFTGKYEKMSDYYSLGILLVELLNGENYEHPYSNLTKEQILEYISNPVNRFPVPENFPESLKKLVYAITYSVVVNDKNIIERRWAYEDIKRLLSGHRTVLFPDERQSEFVLNGNTFKTLEEFKQYIIGFGTDLPSIKKLCGQLINSELKLNEKFEKWLISLGKKEELSSWYKEFDKN